MKSLINHQNTLIMKQLFLILITFNAAIVCAQQTKQPEQLKPPVYDTVSIQLTSRNSFLFCDKVYPIESGCCTTSDISYCHFDTQKNSVDYGYQTGHLKGHDGTSFSFNTQSTKQDKSGFDDYERNKKTQTKKYSFVKMKVTILGQEVAAYRTNFTSKQGYDFEEIVFFAEINGKYTMCTLMLNNKEKTSTELLPMFQQIISF